MAHVSIRDDVLELSDERPRLIGCRCKDCGNHVFPSARGCARCTGTKMEKVHLATEGTLWAWTIQGFLRKAPPYMGPSDPNEFRPFGVGNVELSGQVKVEARLTESDPEAGSVTMEIPVCAWHVCAAHESLPNPNALPEEGCLLICKGAFEHLFDGSGGGLRTEFEPHLPETSCTVRMSWKRKTD